MKTGTLYPLLQMLEDKGFIVARPIPIHGRSRKIYKTTRLGLKYLSLQKEQWIRCVAIVNKILDL